MIARRWRRADGATRQILACKVAAATNGKECSGVSTGGGGHSFGKVNDESAREAKVCQIGVSRVNVHFWREHE